MLVSDDFCLRDDLFSDVEPQLFAIDQALCKLSTSVAHRFEGDYDKPLCLFEVEEHAGSWLLAYLSKRFHLCMRKSSLAGFIYESASYYNVMDYDQLLEKNSEYPLAFYLSTRLDWDCFEEFQEAVVFAKQQLAHDGVATFVLPTFVELDLEKSATQTYVQWVGDEPLALKQMLSQLHCFPRKEYLTVCLQGLEQSLRPTAEEFFKRHRSYFGKHSKGYLFSRIGEHDFGESFNSSQSATLLSFR